MKLHKRTYVLISKDYKFFLELLDLVLGSNQVLG